jgi:hypothetical protein
MVDVELYRRHERPNAVSLRNRLWLRSHKTQCGGDMWALDCTAPFHMRCSACARALTLEGALNIAVVTSPLTVRSNQADVGDAKARRHIGGGATGSVFRSMGCRPKLSFSSAPRRTRSVKRPRYLPAPSD